MPEKINLIKNEEKLARDLARYEQEALELGASRAVILPASRMVVDERVAFKCRVPRCFGYGCSAHCPPHAPTPEEIKKLLAGYEWAVFFTMDVPSGVIVRDKRTIKERIGVYLELLKIVNRIESLAFYDGYYLSFGLSAGSCRHSLCAQQESCAALETGRCRFSLRARPSMEAVGLDVYQMATRQGWDIWPIGSDCQPDQVAKGSLAGIVVIT